MDKFTKVIVPTRFNLFKIGGTEVISLPYTVEVTKTTTSSLSNITRTNTKVYNYFINIDEGLDFTFTEVKGKKVEFTCIKVKGAKGDLDLAISYKILEDTTAPAETKSAEAPVAKDDLSNEIPF